jgi:superoxide dismutase, Fe-Mn family
MTSYELPDLPYDYGALEPHYSAEILQLHHDKHHAAYVEGANKALDRLAAARDSEDFDTIVGMQKTLAFNVSGHVLHSLFWQNLSPDGGGEPDGELRSAIEEDFGSVEACKRQLEAATTTVQGSGWGVLAWEPVGQHLIIEQVYDHQGNVGNGSGPLLAIDGWEHAFYLQFKNVKADYVKSLWNVVNWPDVAARLERMQGYTLI